MADNSPSADTVATRRPVLIALLLAVITLTVFLNVLSAGFVRWDDGMHVYANPYLHPVSAAHLARFWSGPYQNLYVPVSYTVYSLLASLARLPGPVRTVDGFVIDLDPRVFHAASLLLHTANVLLVYALLRRLLPGKGLAGSDWAAAAGALLFALHPVQVESVAWIAEMRGLLAGFLSLLTLLAYVRSAEVRPTPPPKRERGFVVSPSLWYFLATFCFALALLAKPSAVAVPLVAGLIDALLLRRPAKTWLRALIPWGGMCIALLLVTHAAQPVTEDIVTPLWTRPFIAGDALSFYLGKVLRPEPLGIDYGRNPVWLISHKWAYLTWLPAAALGAPAWAGRRRFPAAAAAFGIFAACLLPTLGLTPFVFQVYSTVADRYLYLAMLGPALALAWGMGRLWEPAGKPQLRLATAGMCGIVLLGCALASRAQTRCWQNSAALFTQALAVNPKSWGAGNNLGSVLLDRGNPQESLEPLGMALRERPGYAEAHANLGVAWYRLGEAHRAETEFRAATVFKPEWVTGWNGLGAALLAQNRSAEAAAAFRQALALQPDSLEAQGNLRLAMAAR